MDDETCRYFNEIVGSLRAQYPEQTTFTHDQITQLYVSRWGTTVEDILKQRDSAIEATRAVISDPAARMEQEGKIAEYYDQRRDRFENQLEAAVAEVYRESGSICLVPEFHDQPSQAEPTHSTARYSSTYRGIYQHAEFLQADQTVNHSVRVQSQTSPGVFHNGRVLPGYESINSRNTRPNHSRDSAQPLTPKQQQIPPLSFMQQHRGNTTDVEPHPHFNALPETWDQRRARTEQEASTETHKLEKHPHQQEFAHARVNDLLR